MKDREMLALEAQAKFNEGVEKPFTKYDRHKLANQGYTILRAQFKNIGYWVIVTYTMKGSWMRYSNRWFKTRDEAVLAICQLVSENPDHIIKDK